MLNISTRPNTIRIIKQGDPDWFIYNNNTTAYPRAFIKLSEDCPNNVSRIIQEAFMRNWLTIEANVYEKDYTWEQLSK